jgi:hypothetical protein
VIFLPNPHLDWVGAWTERYGRALMMETKSTSEPRLGLGSKLTTTQIEWLLRWHHAGAAVGVCWEFVGHGVGFIPVGQIDQTLKTGRKHLKWEEVRPVKQGMGFILYDFVPYLRQFYDATSCPEDGQFMPESGRPDVPI